jgi:hypothetical protein
VTGKLKVNVFFQKTGKRGNTVTIPNKNSPFYQRLITNMQTSWIYRCLAWVTTRRVGWIFCGSALVTAILIFFGISENSTQHIYSDLSMVMALFTILAGFFGLSSWSIDRYIKEEETRIAARGGLYSGVIIYLFIMIVTVVQSLH